MRKPASPKPLSHRPCTRTVAPWAASRCAVCAPMPSVAPVTRKFLPSSGAAMAKRSTYCRRCRRRPRRQCLGCWSTRLVRSRALRTRAESRTSASQREAAGTGCAACPCALSRCSLRSKQPMRRCTQRAAWISSLLVSRNHRRRCAPPGSPPHAQSVAAHAIYRFQSAPLRASVSQMKANQRHPARKSQQGPARSAHAGRPLRMQRCNAAPRRRCVAARARP